MICGIIAKKNGNLIGNLLAYYNFNNNVNDITGNGFNGTPNNIDYVAGKSGEAVRFNSSTDYVNIGDSDSLSFTNGVNDLPFSISFYYQKLDTSNAFFLTKRTGEAGTGNEYQVLELSGKLGFYLYSGSNGNYIFAEIPRPATSTWQHLVCTYNGNQLNTGLNIYLNGVLQTVTRGVEGVYNKMANYPAPLYFGRSSFSTAFNLNGYLDGLGIWTKELTQAEVTEIYNIQNGGSELT